MQHAYNPVDWFPWGEEAFAKASREGKPIFLSIGYSTCHWCHVMAHESFEDPEVAAYLNQHFVPVKVDREERPDIDQVYMKVCQLLTGQGGWPLTIIMTPEKDPFFAGTYFPKKASYGLPELLKVLENSYSFWKAGKVHTHELEKAIEESMTTRSKTNSGVPLSKDTLDIAFEELSLAFDERHGGFGNEPKFPSPNTIIYLLRYWEATQKAKALEMAEKTLNSLYRGGIYDHIGFGFSRYSTDRAWLMPHFEKMLYDNALIAYAYLEALQITGNAFYGNAASEIFAYVGKKMTSPEGGFYSAEDADAEGVEGGFYKWSSKEINGVLGEDLGILMCRLYGIGEEEINQGIPNLNGVSFEDLAKEKGLTTEQLTTIYETARAKLFEAREQRVHPQRDEKILTSWNGLMIAALAKGGVVLGINNFIKMAERSADFMLSKLRRADGRLFASYNGGEAVVLGYLDDYAFLAWGLFELYEATFKERYLAEAFNLTRQMIDIFWDIKDKGFFFTGIDGEKMPFRLKEIHDGAMPSGNSVATMNILRLWRVTDDERLTTIATEQISAFSEKVSSCPSSYTFFLTALQYFIGPTVEVVICGDPRSAETKAMIEKIRSYYLPNSTVIMKPISDEGEKILKLVPSLTGKITLAGRATVYICKNYACRKPVTRLEELVSVLNDKKHPILGVS